MDGRRLPGLTDGLNWDLAHRASYQATEVGNGTYRPIEAVTKIITGSHVVLVGVKARGILLHWKTGGWASQNLLTLPASTSEFTAFVKTDSKWLALSQLNLCVFPKLMDTWALRVDIPRWLKDVTVEVWRYDGEDVLENSSTKIEQLSVAASSLSVMLLAKNRSRLGAAILNASPNGLLINLGSPASETSNTASLAPGGYYEIPYAFTGDVWGLWSGAIGEALIDEFL